MAIAVRIIALLLMVYCAINYYHMLRELKVGEGVSQFFANHKYAVETMSALFCVFMFFFVFIVSLIAVYDPERMANYICGGLDAVWTSLWKY